MSYFHSSRTRSLLVIRTIAVAALAALIGTVVQPAVAGDDLPRQLIDGCVGCRLPHDLHGRDLHGLHFVGTDLRDVDFSHADLHGAEFTGANLQRTRFDDANLRDAKFIGVRLDGTSFARAAVGGVRFVGAHVTQGDLSGDAGRVIMHDCTGCSLRGLDLQRADLRGSRVIGANLSDAKLNGANLSGADLLGATLRDATLAGATLGDAIVCGENRDGDYSRRTVCANLRGVDLHGLDLRAVRWCARDDDTVRDCRPVTRGELVEFAHADLTGAQAPT
jgi:uncharacterized protein YjbI with pentapeptide repeats